MELAKFEFDSLFDGLPWNKRISEIATPIEDNLTISLMNYSVRYFRNTSEIEIYLSNSNESKKLEVLFSLITYCKEWINALGGHKDIRPQPIKTLQEKLLRDFNNGNDYRLLYYNDEILPLAMEGYNTFKNCDILSASDAIYHIHIKSAITEAIQIAHLLKFAQGKCDKIDSNSEDAIQDIPEGTLISWTGTPAEFGAIMGELISRGYIQKIRNLKTTVQVLNKFFEVKTDKGDIVKEDYLYKCFGEKKRNYVRGEFRIPFSDNYKQDK
jgi:hypothetical protein